MPGAAVRVVEGPSRDSFARDCAALRSGPVVHALPVVASANLVANALLAVGASPVMSQLAGEIASIHRRSVAAVLTLGTPDGERFDLLRTVLASATARGLPVVLDPVGVGASPLRLELAHELLAGSELVVRGNRGEILALGGAAGAPSPIDDRSGGELPLWELGSITLSDLAARHVLLATGPVDCLWSSDHGYLGRRGHVLQSRVTGMGCALTALVAAFRAVNADAFEAALHALWLGNSAAELAAARAGGPGTFVPGWLDALAFVTENPEEAWRPIFPQKGGQYGR